MYRLNTDSFEVHQKIINLIEKNKKILEIGCASGYLSKEFKKNGCMVTAVEINPAFARKAKKYCQKVIIGDVEQKQTLEKIKGQKFDVIILADVLEHLKNPALTLKSLTKFLKSDGKMIISVPNIGFLTNRLLHLIGRFDYSQWGIMDKTHLRFFTQRTIQQLVENCNLKIENFDFVSNFTQLPFFMQTLFPVVKNVHFWRKIEHKIASLWTQGLAVQFLLIATPKSKTRFNRILFINPTENQQAGYKPSPLGLLYLASFLRTYNKKLTVGVVDGAIEGEKAIIERLKEIKPDLVGVSVLTLGRHHSLKVARLAKQIVPGCKVVFGGIHATLMSQQMMENYSEVDYIVRGEGEVVLNDLVSGKKLNKINGLVFRNTDGAVVKNPNQALIKDINTIPFPAWDLVDLSKYPARGYGTINGINLENEVRFTVIFSRGCMGACTFCSSWIVWTGYRTRTGKNVADEIELLVKNHNAKHFWFCDDTLTGNREEMISFCKEIIKRKLKVAMMGNTRVDKVDEKLLSWMKKAGFYRLDYGIESGSPAMLLKINKRTDLEKIKRAMTITKKSKMQAGALMMYGLPGETEKDRVLSEKLMSQIKPDGIGTLGEVWIFPGTALYVQAKNAKIISDNFWLKKKPYYPYRGGIGNDPINWKLKIKDELKFYLSDTPINKTRIKFLVLKEKIFQKETV